MPSGYMAGFCINWFKIGLHLCWRFGTKHLVFNDNVTILTNYPSDLTTDMWNGTCEMKLRAFLLWVKSITARQACTCITSSSKSFFLNRRCKNQYLLGLICCIWYIWIWPCDTLSNFLLVFGRFVFYKILQRLYAYGTVLY